MSYLYSMHKEMLLVAPSRSHLEKLQRTLRYLRRVDGSLYVRMLRALRGICVHRTKGYVNELFLKPSIWIVQRSTVEESNVPYLASLLVHEYHHLRQREVGQRPTGPRAERRAYLRQRLFLARRERRSDVRWLDQQYKVKWWRTAPSEFAAHAAFRRMMTGDLRLIEVREGLRNARSEKVI
jgi:hypothetical protein